MNHDDVGGWERGGPDMGPFKQQQASWKESEKELLEKWGWDENDERRGTIGGGGGSQRGVRVDGKKE